MAHTASLSQLQTPAWAVVNGELVAYQDVRIHIGAEALTRALSVFEGVKGYWNDGADVFALRTPWRHYRRLCRSAALLHIPVDFSYDEFLGSLATLAERLVEHSRDLWFRPTLFVTRGHWGEGTGADLVVTAFSQRKDDPTPMRLGVSTWRRAGDVSLPTRVKCSANYVVGRLARMEAHRLGCDDAVLLNEAGRVAETSGACILVAQDGHVVSPPPNEGCLDSITVRLLEEVSHHLGITLERRPVERTELLTAEECGLAGTISELTLVAEVDGHRFRDDGVLRELRQGYLEVMRGRAIVPAVEMVPLLDSAGRRLGRAVASV